MKVSSLPIPQNLIEMLMTEGYHDLYPSQIEAVKADVLSGENMLLVTPTASGKTLIAILTAGKTVIEKGGKVIYLTPLRALAKEKYDEFKIFETLKKSDGNNIKVVLSSGDYDSSSSFLKQGDIIILTNEKFDSLLRHGISWIDEVMLFVTDEIHLIGDAYRGPTIETILTKIISFVPGAQILSLSATIKNSKELAKWLNSKIVDTKWRPVKLVEGVYLYGEIFFSDNTTRKIDITGKSAPIDISIDTVKDGGQSLIFTETRRRSVSLALKSAEIIPKYLTNADIKATKSIAKKILAIGEETELSLKLARAVEHGAAFHHAGLNPKHRTIIEEGFKNGMLKILTATPTLAAGVNLPARRVVLSSLFRYNSDLGGQTPISVIDYKQMCGRAGRPKFDTIGETVLPSQTEEEANEIYERYIKGDPEPILSQLGRKGALRTHLLATIATLPGITDSEINILFSKTLFAIQNEKIIVKTKINDTIDFLSSEFLIEKRGNRLLATEFGKKISMLYIDPATGITFRNVIKHTEQRPSIHTGLLHLIVTVPDFTPRFTLRRSDLEDTGLFLEEHKNEFIIEIPEDTDFESYDFFISQFRTLMSLSSWLNEASEEKIQKRHGLEPGDIHRAVENTDWLLYSLAEVCKIVGKTSFLKDIDLLRRRVKYGVKSELLPLTTLDGIGRIRARSLYNAGIKDLITLSKTPYTRIARVNKIGLAIARKIKNQLSS
ncbi:DEAD/DEAH box helicase [Thermoproteota archaeon]